MQHGTGAVIVLYPDSAFPGLGKIVPQPHPTPPTFQSQTKAPKRKQTVTHWCVVKAGETDH